MYADPSRIRGKSVRLNFNERELALIDAYVAYTGVERAAFIRELALNAAASLLQDEQHFEAPVAVMERPVYALKRA